MSQDFFVYSRFDRKLLFLCLNYPCLRNIMSALLTYISDCDTFRFKAKKIKLEGVSNRQKAGKAHMAQANRRKLFGAAAGAAMAGLTAFAPVVATAEDAAPVSYITQEETPISYAAMKLEEYSQETGGVGILISYHPWENGLTGDEIGERLIKRFEQQGSLADYRIVENDQPGFAIIYAVQDTTQGPFSPNDALEVIPDMVAQNEAAKRIRSGEFDLSHLSND